MAEKKIHKVTVPPTPTHNTGVLHLYSMPLFELLNSALCQQQPVVSQGEHGDILYGLC